MLIEERHQTILSLLESESSVRVAELRDRFEVSEMTIRRDLYLLERKGLLRRVHGGAVNTRGRSYEPPYLSRAAVNREAKERIGQVAAELVEDGDSITLDVGTTTLEMAQHLQNKNNLTLVTPSLHIANTLSQQPNIRLILTGGILRPGELSLVGNMSERTFDDFFVDKLFLGIGGIDLTAGLSEFNLEDALVKKAMINSAKEVIVLADASKFEQIAFAFVAPIDVIDRIVTDSTLDEHMRSMLESHNIEVILA
jgi:DeoR/GlpR family transcriptional regulator of sugar metabolism